MLALCQHQTHWYPTRSAGPSQRTGRLRGPHLRAGLTVQALFWCQQAASYLLLGLFLQQGRGLGALPSGGVFAVPAAGYLLTSLRASGLTVRFGRRVIATGAVGGAAGDLLLVLAVWHGASAARWPRCSPGCSCSAPGRGCASHR
jgi:hypothetical protein